MRTVRGQLHLHSMNAEDASVDDVVITNSSHSPLTASSAENGFGKHEKKYQVYQFHETTTLQPAPQWQCPTFRQTMVFIERDYNVDYAWGTQFISEFPHQLTNKVDKEEFENTIAEINIRFQKADFVSLCQRFFTVIDVCTCYIMSLICFCGSTKRRYKKWKKQLAAFIDQENDKYRHLGIRIENPFNYGLRYIVVHYDNPSTTVQ